MTSHTIHRRDTNPLLTTDIIIEYSDGSDEGIVLITRKNYPYGIALPGGFAESGLTLEENAAKEAKEETGLEIIVNEPEMPFCIHSDPARDPRAHIISVTYIAKGTGKIGAGDDAASARLYTIPEIQELIEKGRLAFDHAKTLEKYLREKGHYESGVMGAAKNPAEDSLGKKLGRVGVIGRFKPLHNGSATMLETVCEQAEHVTIGIGSCNKYNARNPFTAEETREMINAYLSPRFSNYNFVEIPDYGHIPEFRDGRKWAGEVASRYGALDAFVTANGYVKELLEQGYTVINPANELIPPENWVRLNATTVRMEMAKAGNWKALVPAAVADYMESHGLAERFRREFGLETIAQLAGKDYRSPENVESERLHPAEV